VHHRAHIRRDDDIDVESRVFLADVYLIRRSDQPPAPARDASAGEPLEVESQYHTAPGQALAAKRAPKAPDEQAVIEILGLDAAFSEALSPHSHRLDGRTQALAGRGEPVLGSAPVGVAPNGYHSRVPCIPST